MRSQDLILKFFLRENEQRNAVAMRNSVVTAHHFIRNHKIRGAEPYRYSIRLYAVVFVLAIYLISSAPSREVF